MAIVVRAVPLNPGDDGGGVQRVFECRFLCLFRRSLRRGGRLLRPRFGGGNGRLRPVDFPRLRGRLLSRGESRLGSLEILSRAGGGGLGTTGAAVRGGGRRAVDGPHPRGERSAGGGVPLGQLRGEQLLDPRRTIDDGDPESLEREAGGGHVERRAGLRDQQLERFLPRIEGEPPGHARRPGQRQLPDAGHHERRIRSAADGILVDGDVDDVSLHLEPGDLLGRLHAVGAELKRQPQRMHEVSGAGGVGRQPERERRELVEHRQKLAGLLGLGLARVAKREVR